MIVPSQPKIQFGIILLLFLTCVLYLSNINRVMQCDEANTLYQYASSLPRAVLSYATPNNHILHSVSVWFTTQLAGTSAPVVRLTALSAALLSLALVYRIGMTLAGWRAGLAAAVFMATNFAFADFAINARGYSLSVFFTLALIHEVFLRQKARGYLILLISAALLLVLPSMLLLHVGVFAWLVWKKRGQRDLLPFLLPLVFGVLIAVSVYVPSIAYGLIGEHFSQFGETDLLALVQNSMLQLFATPITGIVFAVCALIGCFYVPRWRAFTLITLAMMLVVSAVQLLVLEKLFWTRNYFFLLGPIALLAGVGFSRIVKQPVLVVGLAALALVLFPGRQLDGYYSEKDLVGLIERNTDAHDQIITAPCFNAPVQHYLLHHGREEQLFSTAQTERVFVLTNNFPVQEVLEMFDAQAQQCQPVTDGSWASWDVYICRPN